MKKEELPSFYIPVLKSIYWAEISGMADKLRKIEKRDDGSIGLTFLMIETKGKGARASFQGYDIVKADVGKVGAKYSEIWIRHSLLHAGCMNINKPVRFANDSKTILVLE